MQTVSASAVDSLRLAEQVTLIIGNGSPLDIYEARVEEIINGGVVITDAAFASACKTLDQQARVTVQYSRGKAVFQFVTGIKTICGEPSPKVMLAPPQNLYRVQRRTFVRLGIEKEILYAVVPPKMSWIDWEDEISWHKAVTTDISGSGLLIEKAEHISENDLVLLQTLFLREVGVADPVLAICRRIDTESSDYRAGLEIILGSDLGKYVGEDNLPMVPRSAIHFGLLQQVKISHFVFNQQIKLRGEKR